MSDNERFTRKLQKIVGRILPRGLDKIIIEAGFDAESAIATIDLNSIINIQDHINENKIILKDTVYESVLENDLQFKLKPGHKSIILDLPKLLKEFEAKKRSAPNPQISNEEEEEKQREIESLKKQLINKLNGFARKCMFDITFEETSIFDFREEKAVYKCRFECPICMKKIRCEYKRYWFVSNFQKHIKNHLIRDIRVETVELDIEATEQFEVGSTEKPISFVSGQMDDLDAVLEDN